MDRAAVAQSESESESGEVSNIVRCWSRSQFTDSISVNTMIFIGRIFIVRVMLCSAGFDQNKSLFIENASDSGQFLS